VFECFVLKPQREYCSIFQLLKRPFVGIGNDGQSFDRQRFSCL
jgi:hypothetical protein